VTRRLLHHNPHLLSHDVHQSSDTPDHRSTSGRGGALFIVSRTTTCDSSRIDEHGETNLRAARERGMDPKRMSDPWQPACVISGTLDSRRSPNICARRSLRPSDDECQEIQTDHPGCHGSTYAWGPSAVSRVHAALVSRAHLLP